jgi:hypothetical protein
MQLTIEGDGAIVAAFDAYPARTSRAMVRSLNRAIKSGSTLMVRAIAQDTGLRSTDVRKALPITEATISRPVAQLAASLKRIPLIQWKARQTRRGVSYRLKGGQGRHPHAFLATMKSGHEGVFARRGRARLEIDEQFGPSLGLVFRKYRPEGEARVVEMFRTNLDHELARAAGVK